MKLRKILLIASMMLVVTISNGFCEDDSLVVSENGNVGIGTTNPQSGKLEIIHTIPGSESEALFLRNLSNNQSTAVSLNFTTYTQSRTAAIRAVNEATGTAKTRLEFCTHNNGNMDPRMTIDPDGNVGIGTTNPEYQLELYRTSGNTALTMTNSTSHRAGFELDGAVLRIGDRWSSYGDGALAFHTAGSERVKIDTNGRVGIGISSPSYKLDVNGTIRGDNVSPSDARWKTNVTTLENALEKVTDLRGVRYEWTDTSKGIGDQIGLIAQEVEEVFPEAVSTDNQGYKSVAYSKLVSPLIEAVKTLKAENDRLKQDNEEIRDQLAEIKSMLEKLQ